MNEVNKRESDVAAAAGGDNDIITIPKKRGRPAKPNQLPKKPSSGRGRGRPPKNAASTAPVAVSSGSDNEDREEDVVTNGGDVQSRGRPLKVATAVSVPAVGKQKSARVEAAAKAAVKISKIQQKSDEDSEELEPLPKVAGGSRGRPRKNPVAGSPPSPAATVVVGNKRSKLENGGSVAEVPKKRGRPALGLAKVQPKASPKASSGKPRGRPKKPITNNKDDEDKNSDDGGNSSESFKSVEEYNNGGSTSGGRSKPKATIVDKSQGRPKKASNEKKEVKNSPDASKDRRTSEKMYVENSSSSDDDDKSSEVY